MKPIYADFMKSDATNRLVLTCLGTQKDLEKYGVSLKDGLTLVFYNDDEDTEGKRDDLLVKGVVEYDSVNERWVAIIDWNAIKNASELSEDEKRDFETL